MRILRTMLKIILWPLRLLIKAALLLVIITLTVIQYTCMIAVSFATALFTLLGGIFIICGFLIFLMGLYEVQIMESYGTDPANMTVPFYADGQAASIYGQNSPLVNLVRKPGEWQVYDIVFHAPRVEGGKITRPADVTVFLNGVLVQDHWILEGPTKHCRRVGQTAPSTSGPIRLQYHNCPVQYRNIWVRGLPLKVTDKR